MLMKTGRGALRTKQENRKLLGFSKVWQSGEKIVVYYPLTINEADGLPDIVVYNAFGHSVDINQIKSLHRTFVPSMAGRNEEGEVITPDFLLKFSRIAKLFRDGEKQAKLNTIANNSKLDKKTKDVQNKQIEEAYENISPVIGPLRDLTTTECLAVPLNSDGSPNKDRITLCTQDLSEERLGYLQNILSNPKCFVDAEHMWLEVEYVMGSSGKHNQDGRVRPDGIDEKYQLSAVHPALFTLFASRLEGLPKNSEMIKRRNSSFHNIELGDIISALSTFVVLNCSSLESLADDNEAIERLKKSAEILDSLGAEISYIDFHAEAELLKGSTSEEEVLDSEKKHINFADEGVMPTEDQANADAAADEALSAISQQVEKKTPEDSALAALGI